MTDDLTRREVLRQTLDGETITRETDERPPPPEEHVIGFAQGGNTGRARAMADQVKTEIDFQEVGKVVVGRFADQALDRLRSRSDVRYVERDQQVSALAQTTPWGIQKIDADTAQSSGDTATGIDVAVLDTGIDSDHPDLDGNLGTGKAFIDCGTDANGNSCSSISGSCDLAWDDDDGHGTHVAGTVAAEDNTEGVLGVAPTTTVHAVKVLDCNGSGTGSALANGLEHAVTQGWDIANMSLGFGFDSNGDPVRPSLVEDAIDFAANRNVLMVAAAGNDGEDPVCNDGQCVQYPASDTDVIAVSALMNNDDIAPFSNRGDEIELGAPGGGDVDGDGNECPNEMIYSTVPTETTISGQTYSYLCYNGTSMASPHVAGAAALSAGEAGLWNREGLRAKLNATADDVSLSSTEQGNGRVDAAGATPEVTEFTLNLNERFQYASPAADSSRVFVGGLGRSLYAIKKSDGSFDWSIARDGDLADSSPTVSGGSVFVGSGGGTVYSLNATDGSENWTHQTASAHVSSPTVAGGVLYVGSNDGTVLALAESDGTVQWTTDVGGAVYSKPVVDSGTVYLTTAGGDVVALDTSNGNELWRFAAGAELGHAGVAVGNSRVYVAGDQMYARNAGDGTGVWSTSYGGASESTPEYDSNTGLVYAGSADGSVYAFDDSNSGSVAWSYATGDAVAGSPRVVGTGVIVCSDDGTLYLLNGSNGRRQDNFGVGTVRSKPVVSGDATYVTTWDGTVVTIKSLVG